MIFKCKADVLEDKIDSLVAAVHPCRDETCHAHGLPLDSLPRAQRNVSQIPAHRDWHGPWTGGARAGGERSSGQVTVSALTEVTEDTGERRQRRWREGRNRAHVARAAKRENVPVSRPTPAILLPAVPGVSHHQSDQRSAVARPGPD